MATGLGGGAILLTAEASIVDANPTGLNTNYHGLSGVPSPFADCRSTAAFPEKPYFLRHFLMPLNNNADNTGEKQNSAFSQARAVTPLDAPRARGTS